jgi:hypothetical protein
MNVILNLCKNDRVERLENNFFLECRTSPKMFTLSKDEAHCLPANEKTFSVVERTLSPRKTTIVFEARENPSFATAYKLLKHFDEIVPEEVRAGWHAPNGRIFQPEKVIRDYLAKRESDGIPVRYVHATNATSGRRFPIGLSGMTSFPRPIRHTIAAGLYHDIDIKNAHPIFAAQLARKAGINVSAIEYYNKNRDACIKELMLKNSLSKDVAKRVPISLLNGGNEVYENLRIRPKWLSLFKTDATSLHNYIILRDDLHETISRVKEIKGKCYKNLHGSVFNHILCDIEDKCLMAAVAELKRQGVPNTALVLCFDGLMIPTHLWKPNAGALQSINSAVASVTGYVVEFVEKPMDEGYDTSNLPDVDDAPEPIEIVKDDAEAATKITKRLLDRGLIKSCGSYIYVKKDHIWTNNSKEVDEFLMVFLSRANLMFECLTTIRKPYSGFVKNVRACIPLVKAYTKMHNDSHFHDSIYSSTAGKICFADGVFDVEEGVFTLWGDLREPVYSTVKIGDKFRPRDQEINECIDELHRRVILPIFGTMDKARPFLSAVARGIAGKVVDKQFLAIIGERDCGKGVFTDALTAALGGEGIYTATASMENLLMIRNRDSSDTAKKQGWMMSGEHTRFLLMNEVATNAEDTRHKLNGDLIKRLVGGDMLEGRNLYEQTRHFRVMAKPFLCCNDLPPFSSPDALQSAFLFVAPHKFVSTEMMESAPRNYRLRDDTLKGWVVQPTVRSAFFHLLVSYYVNEKVEPLGDAKRVRDDLRMDNNDDLMIFNQLVRATNDASDIIKVSELDEALSRAGTKMTGAKIRMRMENLGGMYVHGRIHGVLCRYYKNVRLIANDDDDDL